MRYSFLSGKAVKIVLTISLLAVLAVVVEWQEFKIVIEQVDWFMLLPIYIVLESARIVEAYQLMSVLKFFKRATSLTTVYLTNAIATFYGFILPGQLLATIPKWLILSNVTGSRSDVLSAIVYNRIALLIPPIVITCVALAITNPFDKLSTTYLLVASGSGLIIVVLLLLNRTTGGFLLWTIEKTVENCSPKIAIAIAPVIASFSRIHELKFHRHLVIYILSTSVSIIRILAFIIASHIVLIDVPPYSLAFAYTLIVILGLFPLTIGNIGIREGVLVYVLQMYGTAPTQSILLGMILFGSQIIFAIVGGIYQVSLTRKTAIS